MALIIEANGVARINSPTRSVMLAPGDVELAELVLSEDELAQVTKAWTPKLVKAWNDAQPEPTVDEPQPTDKERIAELEAALVKLSEGKAIPAAQVDKWRGKGGD